MTLRETNLERLEAGPHDVLILGGGINGAVSAACLAARGAKVALIDRKDFASGCSQESSNLAWGGIKYMETLEFPLVRKLCVSRNLLLRSYPSQVREIRFYVSHERGFRHGLWKLWLGAWLYWLLGSCFTKIPRLLSRERMKREERVLELDGTDGGFEYSDAYLLDNDARFVWTFVRQAIDRGCAATNYVESLGAEREGGLWHVRARDRETGREFTIRAKMLINACGPYADAHNALTGQRTAHRHVFSKGIHLIVRRITESRRILTFFADDGRLFFAIPMGPRTCIGTTDTRVDGPKTEVTDADRRFVLDNINKRLELEEPLTQADIVAERCGVRPLVVEGGGGDATDWLQLSRKHAIEIDAEAAHVTVFGGKLTDCLNVGEEIARAAIDVGVALPHPRRAWYGEGEGDAREAVFREAAGIGLDLRTAPGATETLTARLWRRYGEDARAMIAQVAADPSLAEPVVAGAQLVRVEVVEARRREMIVSLEDFVRRRSNLALLVRRDDLRASPGLREACDVLFGDDAAARFAAYFDAH